MARRDNEFLGSNVWWWGLITLGIVITAPAWMPALALLFPPPAPQPPATGPIEYN